MIVRNFLSGAEEKPKSTIYVTGLNSTDTVYATSPSGKRINAVWGRKKNPDFVLPSGMKQLEYIQSTGTQYIDTGYYPNNNTQLDMLINITTDGAWLSPFGERYRVNTSGSNNRMFYIERDSLSSKRWQFAYGTAYYSPADTTTVGAHDISIDGNVWKFGNISHTFSSTTFTSNVTMAIFAKNQAGAETFTQGFMYMQCYGYRIAENGIDIQNTKPAMRLSDNAIGMYDLVSGTFFGNSGTGSFVAGPEVPEYIDCFIIEVSELGNFVITASNGTKTVTENVMVDVATEYEVEMAL